METGCFSALPNLQNPLTVKEQAKEEDTTVYRTDVAIIGNGPSGLALSAFLSGWRPFYDLANPHPNRELHERLTKYAQATPDSLLEQDLSWAHQTLADLVSIHPLSLLYDWLARPDADIGHDHPSSLRWEHDEEYTIPHVVLGAGPPGGIWHTFHEEMTPVSLSRWLELPGVPTVPGENGSAMPSQRLPIWLIRSYLYAYPKLTDTKKHHIPFTTVTDLRRVGDEWQLSGWHPDGPFCFRAHTVVLATGLNVPRQLGVPGEGDNDRLFYNISDFKRTLSENESLELAQDPVLIIGDGLTAADAVLFCLKNRLPVRHCFRKGQREIRGTMLGRLSATLYPEYHKVVRLMQGKISDPLYTFNPNTKVLRLDPEHHVATLEVNDPKSVHTPSIAQLQYSYTIVCIGRGFELDYLHPDQRSVLEGSKVLKVDPVSYKSQELPGIFAVGPLVGENFVRYLVGGAMVVAKQIIKEASG